MQSRNRNIDIENKLTDTQRERGSRINWVIGTDLLMCKIDN